MPRMRRKLPAGTGAVTPVPADRCDPPIQSATVLLWAPVIAAVVATTNR
jgi:hypothetical protein